LTLAPHGRSDFTLDIRRRLVLAEADVNQLDRFQSEADGQRGFTKGPLGADTGEKLEFGLDHNLEDRWRPQWKFPYDSG
jgi:hypothetical protein